MSIEDSDLVADILIVDDKLENIRLLSSFLSTQQYQVRKAINGQSALMAARTITPDLILLDINMPGMNGYEVCEHLKREPELHAVPIIFLSASSDLGDKVRAFEVGGVDYITKPFQLEEVLVRVRTQLTIRELQKQLETKNMALNQALDNLKEAQVGLIQQEKMSTLKKVVSGVAHEINNPLSFIAGNINPIREYSHSLLELIDLYQRKYGDKDPEIIDLLNKIELDFLVSDLNKTLDSIANGAERISTVVLALRIFTRLDESGVKSIDMHDCLDNTLTLLHHRLSPTQPNINPIEVYKDYGELPLITCYAEQLTQAVFNLLCNAIDAVELKRSNISDPLYEPQISIHTRIVDGNQLVLQIKDNGIGITEASQSHLFEPFFTTKSAGQGVGLGLATSQRIVEEMHKGNLTYYSQAGKGSEFVIQMPIHGVG